jgi:hypothetical protein
MTEKPPKPTDETGAVGMTRYGQPIYASNPTIPAAGAISKTRRAQIGDEKRGVVIDQSNGEILGHGGAMIYEFEEVDKERFVKLYLAGLKSAVGMSKAGMEVFQAVYDQMRENKQRDFVLLSAHDAKMNDRTFQRGLRELIERKFLYRGTIQGMFWINIQYMFNGNRLAFVKAYQIKGSGQQLSMFDDLEGGEE